MMLILCQFDDVKSVIKSAHKGCKDHDRWLLARRRLEGKLKSRRSTSR
jgi:hypothetical protein